MIGRGTRRLVGLVVVARDAAVVGAAVAAAAYFVGEVRSNQRSQVARAVAAGKSAVPPAPYGWLCELSYEGSARRIRPATAVELAVSQFSVEQEMAGFFMLGEDGRPVMPTSSKFARTSHLSAVFVADAPEPTVDVEAVDGLHEFLARESTYSGPYWYEELPHGGRPQSSGEGQKDAPGLNVPQGAVKFGPVRHGKTAFVPRRPQSNPEPADCDPEYHGLVERLGPTSATPRSDGGVYPSKTAEGLRSLVDAGAEGDPTLGQFWQRAVRQVSPSDVLGPETEPEPGVPLALYADSLAGAVMDLHREAAVELVVYARAQMRRLEGLGEEPPWSLRRVARTKLTEAEEAELFRSEARRPVVFDTPRLEVKLDSHGRRIVHEVQPAPVEWPNVAQRLDLPFPELDEGDRLQGLVENQDGSGQDDDDRDGGDLTPAEEEAARREREQWWEEDQTQASEAVSGASGSGVPDWFTTAGNPAGDVDPWDSSKRDER